METQCLFTKHNFGNAGQCREYISTLIKADLLYHFDDDAADCLRDCGLTVEQLEIIQSNVNQFQQINFGAEGCAIGYALSITDGEDV